MPNSPHDSIAVLVILVFAAYVCAFYWRMTLRLFAVLLIALAVYGLIASLHVL